MPVNLYLSPVLPKYAHKLPLWKRVIVLTLLKLEIGGILTILTENQLQNSIQNINHMTIKHEVLWRT
jgi:hypothetical protein